MKDPIPTIKREGFHFDLSNMKKRLLLRNSLLCSFNLLYLMKSVYFFTVVKEVSFTFIWEVKV